MKLDEHDRGARNYGLTLGFAGLVFGYLNKSLDVMIFTFMILIVTFFIGLGWLSK